MVFNVKHEMMFVLNEFNRAVLKRFYKCIKKKKSCLLKLKLKLNRAIMGSDDKTNYFKIFDSFAHLLIIFMQEK